LTELPKLIHSIKLQLEKPLPGWTAQSKLSPIDDPRYRQEPTNHLKAAVIALLYYHESKLMICYMKRTSHFENDKHKGQISFPGGKLEANESLEECAKRETQEEIGVSAEHYILLGKLTPIYVFVSNFVVYPYVAFSSSVPIFTPDASEVEKVIVAPIQNLMKGVHKKDIQVRNFVMKDAPYYPLKISETQAEILWGATAMMTAELLEIIEVADS